MKKKILVILLVLIFSNAMSGQVNTAPNDCVNAIVVCGNGTFSSNASGFGKQEVSACGTGSEHNSIWLKINIIQAGKLGFDLIPDDPDISADFDFWVYGPNKGCPSTTDSALRCCVTNPQEAGLTGPNANHTGINGSTLATSAYSGPGGNNLPYVQWLDVKVGESYYIAVDRPYSTPSGDTGFQIQWTGTAMAGAGAFPTPPVANKILDQVTCTSSNVGIFNLNALRSQINSQPNTTITFHETLANAVDGKSPLGNLISVNIANPKPIYAKVVNNISGPAQGCFDITDFTLRVFPIPTASIALAKPAVCLGENAVVTISGTVGATIDYQIDNGQIQSVLLDSSGTFVISDAVSSNRTYTVLRAKILDGNGNEVCFTNYVGQSNSASVTVNPLPTISGTLSICQNATSQLTGSTAPSTTTTPWTSSNTAVATLDPTTLGLVTGVGVGTSDITFTDNNGCSATSVFTVSALPTISGKPSICVGTSTTLTATPATATSTWTSSDSSIATVSPNGSVFGVAIGTATITYTDANGCSSLFSIDVTASNNTQTATAVVSNYFSDNMTITVTVVGDATYLYSLDGGEFQTSNVFSNVAPGLHTVVVNDTDGCTDITIDNILAIGYPHFFTPNNDGFNDIWNISSLLDIQPDAEIFIFDRYGKLLKRITPAGEGWDGTYNGHPMPSSDYWFTVRYIENGAEKLFKSHFSLKR